jgi:hypothetical protein
MSYRVVYHINNRDKMAAKTIAHADAHAWYDILCTQNEDGYSITKQIFFPDQDAPKTYSMDTPSWDWDTLYRFLVPTKFWAEEYKMPFILKHAVELLQLDHTKQTVEV